MVGTLSCVPCSSCSTYSHNLCLTLPCNNGFLHPLYMQSISLPPTWGNQLDLCVKQGPTFCLHGVQAYIMGPCWDICYPSIPLRDSVPAPVPLPPHIMALPSPLVTAIPLDNPTPAPIDRPLPQCPYTSAYPHMPQRCYKTDRVLSCYTNGRKYSIGNLTTNSYWGYSGPVCPMVTGSICWVSNTNDWLESVPQPNRTCDLDPGYTDYLIPPIIS
jgi:hypothetical protein